MSDAPTRTIIIYLLHYTLPDGRARHYIGSARKDQLERRLRDHKQGHASRFSRKMWDAKARCHLARTWTTDTRWLEKVLKRNHRYHRYCPLCSELPEGLAEPPGKAAD